MHFKSLFAFSCCAYPVALYEHYVIYTSEQNLKSLFRIAYLLWALCETAKEAKPCIVSLLKTKNLPPEMR